jgi:galactokinase
MARSNCWGYSYWAGLSSSAALEVAAVLAFHEPSRQPSRDPAFIAKLASEQKISG